MAALRREAGGVQESREMGRCYASLLCLWAAMDAAALVARPPVAARLPAAAGVRFARVAMQVAEPPVKVPEKVPDLAPASPDMKSSLGKAKKYKLLLFNDNVNRREYVAKVLVGSVPDLTQADAYVIMQKAHKSGMAVVGVWVLEVCEAYCDLLRNGGLIASVAAEDDDE